MLNKKAILDYEDFDGNTPLARAFLYSKPDTAIHLIQNGADVMKWLYVIHPNNLLNTKSTIEEYTSVLPKMVRMKNYNIGLYFWLYFNSTHLLSRMAIMEEAL